MINTPFSPRQTTGFSLIELMIAVAIVGILSAIAYPSYTDYVLRGRLVDPTNSLTVTRLAMEQYYQDNRTYASVSAAIVSPCLATQPVVKFFAMTCSLSAAPAVGYTATATGNGGTTTGFVYTINQTDLHTSTVSTAWGGATSQCWIMKNGSTC
ncbi:type IV pilin protein [Actimicrobium antarcticum]|uniref:Type IV pilin protein n=1 Tax=Actimicrobium antarcticum TaxID=1051899 RepID=A0ABP7TU11_9BURK